MQLIRAVCLAFALNAMSVGVVSAATTYALETTQKLLSCYKAGNDTVSTMYACSGQWVTPRILTLCFLEADRCPVIPDTSDAESVVAAALGGENPLGTKLSIDFTSVLTIPDRSIIDSCKSSSTTGQAPDECAARKMSEGSLAPFAKCAAETTEVSKAICLTKGSPAEVAKLIECVSKGAINEAAISKCVPAHAPAWAEVQNARKCIEGSSGSAIVDCLFPSGDAQTKALAGCIATSPNDTKNATRCLSKFDMKTGAQIEQLTCVARANDEAAITLCLIKDTAGDGAKVAACAAGDKEKIVSCLFGNRPEYQAASAVVACVHGGRDASSLIANCSSFIIKDAKTRAVLACAAHAGSDTKQLEGCAASAVLPPEVARYAACAATSTGPTSFGLCAAGPVMNEEWRIAAECAVETGGNPVGFAGCTAGRLTLKELTQCFTGGSCFGPNNTIVQAFKTSFNDLLYGPGANNDIIVVLRKLEQASGGPNSVINNPGQIFGGANSIFKNPGQIAGGEHSAINEFLRTPLGGNSSVVNQVIQKPLGGSNSVVNQVIEKPLGGPNSVPNKVIDSAKKCFGLCK